MRDVVVVGGGCYGAFYAGQLAKARQKGKARYRRVVVVDRNADCRALRALVRRLRAAGEPVLGPALFVCRHHVFGVGTVAVDAVLEGDEIVKAAGQAGEAAAVLVGTISSCHGALNLLKIGPSSTALD